jgi:hypothetical protein
MPFLNGIALVWMILHTFNLKSRLVNGHPISWHLQIQSSIRHSLSALSVPFFSFLRDLVLLYNQSSRLDLGMPNLIAALLIFMLSSTTAIVARRSSSFQFPFFFFFRTALCLKFWPCWYIIELARSLSVSSLLCVFVVESFAWLA